MCVQFCWCIVFSSCMNLGIFPFFTCTFCSKHFTFPGWDQSQMDTSAAVFIVARLNSGAIAMCYWV